jgi:hypothetical protein
MAVRADDGKVLDGSIQAARYCPDGRVSWKQPVGMKNQFLWHMNGRSYRRASRRYASPVAALRDRQESCAKRMTSLGAGNHTPADGSMVTGVICCGCTTISHLDESLDCAGF